MSYRCTLCHTAQPQGTEAYFLIIEKRDRIYHCKDKNGRPKTTKGWEIIKEIIVCADCYRKGIK